MEVLCWTTKNISGGKSRSNRKKGFTKPKADEFIGECLSMPSIWEHKRSQRGKREVKGMVIIRELCPGPVSGRRGNVEKTGMGNTRKGTRKDRGREKSVPNRGAFSGRKGGKNGGGGVTKGIRREGSP